MIKAYIREIHSIFLDQLDHYKENFGRCKSSDFEKTQQQVLSLEKKLGVSFSENLIEFLRWFGTVPIDMATFFTVDSAGENYRVWSQRIEWIEANYEKESSNKKQRLLIFRGGFNKKNDYLLKIFVDVLDKEAVYAVYGEKDLQQYGVFKHIDQVTTIKLSNSIEDFCKRYLIFLRSLPKSKQNLKKLEKLFCDKTKLFRFVKNYNWDDGLGILEEIVKDPRCDKATALLIYWLSEPYSYDQKIAVQNKLLPNIIENNIAADFYTNSENKFDPSLNQFADFIQEYRKCTNKNREIPKFMLQEKV